MGLNAPDPYEAASEQPKTIYTARMAGEGLVSEEFPNPWYVQVGFGTEQEFNDGKVVFTDLDLVNGPEEASEKAQEIASPDDLVLGI